MSQIERIGVSVEEDLLADFDKLIAGLGYKNRSEAIRDLIREKLTAERLKDSRVEAIGAIFLVYDHHTAHISKLFHRLGKNTHVRTVSSLHIYVGGGNCLEILVLRGSAGQIKSMGEKMISMRGVKQGHINLVAINS